MPQHSTNRFYRNTIRKSNGCGELYIPTDNRHKYCSKQCGDNARNDLRRQKRKTRYANEGVLRKYDSILEELYEKIKSLNIKTVTWRDLQIAGINKQLYIERVRGEKNVIHFVYEYGLMPADNSGNEMIICKR